MRAQRFFMIKSSLLGSDDGFGNGESNTGIVVAGFGERRHDDVLIVL